MKSVGVAIAVFATVGFLIGCDSGAPAAQNQHPAAARAAAIAAQQQGQAKTAALVEVDEDEVTNERWDMLAEHFERFAMRPPSTHKDIFRSNLDKFAPPIDPSVAEGLDSEGVETLPDPMEHKKEDTPPLKRFAADEFKAVIVMTGTATPKALLKDPKGDTHIVTLDDEVGNEDGVVASITQHEVVIKHADPKPVRLSVRPTLFEVGDRQQRELEKLEGDD